jgi:hypothetical protein
MIIQLAPAKPNRGDASNIACASHKAEEEPPPCESGGDTNAFAIAPINGTPEQCAKASPFDMRKFLTAMRPVASLLALLATVVGEAIGEADSGTTNCFKFG